MRLVVAIGHAKRNQTQAEGPRDDEKDDEPHPAVRSEVIPHSGGDMIRAARALGGDREGGPHHGMATHDRSRSGLIDNHGTVRGRLRLHGLLVDLLRLLRLHDLEKTNERSIHYVHLDFRLDLQYVSQFQIVNSVL